PLANVLLLAGAVQLLPLDVALESTFFNGFVPVRMFILCNVVLLVYSLWPYEANSSYGKTANDALLLWRTLRRPKSEIEQFPAAFYFYEAEECRRQRRYDEAQRWVDEGLRRFPRDFRLEMTGALNFLCLKKYRNARRAFVLVL